MTDRLTNTKPKTRMQMAESSPATGGVVDWLLDQQLELPSWPNTKLIVLCGNSRQGRPVNMKVTNGITNAIRYWFMQVPKLRAYDSSLNHAGLFKRPVLLDAEPDTQAQAMRAFLSFGNVRRILYSDAKGERGGDAKQPVVVSSLSPRQPSACRLRLA